MIWVSFSPPASHHKYSRVFVKKGLMWQMSKAVGLEITVCLCSVQLRPFVSSAGNFQEDSQRGHSDSFSLMWHALLWFAVSKTHVSARTLYYVKPPAPSAEAPPLAQTKWTIYSKWECIGLGESLIFCYMCKMTTPDNVVTIISRHCPDLIFYVRTTHLSLSTVKSFEGVHF